MSTPSPTPIPAPLTSALKAEDSCPVLLQEYEVTASVEQLMIIESGQHESYLVSINHYKDSRKVGDGIESLPELPPPGTVLRGSAIVHDGVMKSRNGKGQDVPKYLLYLELPDNGIKPFDAVKALETPSECRSR